VPSAPASIGCGCAALLHKRGGLDRPQKQHHQAAFKEDCVLSANIDDQVSSEPE
jgi:hypothetical protein